MPLTHYLYGVVGALMVLFIGYDMIWSTLSAADGGPLTRRWARLLWYPLRYAPHPGALLVFSVAATWILWLWAGWALMTMSHPLAVVDADTGLPAGFWDRVYFSGYTLFTLGLGDYFAAVASWRVLTAVIAGAGLFLVTLAITYLLSVLTAVIEAQRLATRLRTMGDTPAEIVANAWDAQRKQFKGLDTILDGVASSLLLHARRHRAYPVLHYFRDADAGETLAVQVARFDEALSIWRYAVPAADRPGPLPLRMARQAVVFFNGALRENFVGPAAEAPPPPVLTALERAGVPHDPAALRTALPALANRRRMLRGYVEDFLFDWSDVAHAPKTLSDDAVVRNKTALTDAE